MNITPFNGLKCLVHAERIKKILKGVLPSPVCAQIDLCNICNHNCLWCYYRFFRHRAPVMMPTTRSLSLIDELASFGVKSALFTGGGEPLMHPDFCKIIRHAHSNGLKVGLSTNGALLDEDKIDAILECCTYIRISIDAGCDNIHRLIHNGEAADYETIRLWAKTINIYKRPSLTTGYGFLVCDQNVMDIEEAVDNAVQARFDYIQFRPVIGEIKLTEIFCSVVNEAIARMRTKYPDFKILGGIGQASGKKKFETCRATPLITIIGSDLKIYLCCQFRGDLNWSIGDITSQNFKNFWRSDKHREIIDKIDGKRCPVCKYEKYNAVIEHVFVQNDMHKEFL